MEIWNDELGSQLARELDASIFLHSSARVSASPYLLPLAPRTSLASHPSLPPLTLSSLPACPQLASHPASGPAFNPHRTADQASGTRVFPYGAVAHESAARIQRAWYRFNQRSAGDIPRRAA